MGSNVITYVVFVWIVECIDNCGFGGPFILVDRLPQFGHVTVRFESQNRKEILQELLTINCQLKRRQVAHINLPTNRCRSYDQKFSQKVRNTKNFAKKCHLLE